MSNDAGVLLDKFDEINLEELEREIFEDQQLKTQLMSEVSALEENRDQIGNPDALTDTIVNIVWEQFENQVAAQAGKDFIRENHGKNLDLRKDAHIQTAENFENGKIATHNDRIDYQERYDDWQSNFQKNEDGSVMNRVDKRSGETKKVLTPKARAVFDQNRPKGSKTVNKDHVIPAAEIIRDPAAAAHMTKDEQIAFANSDINLMDLDAAANQSKGDSKMKDWLESERNGQKPGERFDIDEDKLKEKDQLAREEYEKKKKEAEGKSIEAGIASRKDEALRIGKKTARAVIMNLLSELVKSIVRKLILWLKSAEKSFETLVKAIKESIKAFISDIRSKVVNVTETAATVIMASIVGPIVNTIKKTWIIIKQGLASLKQAIRHLLDSQNRKKPKDILLMEVGKIILTGVTAVGAMSLGELIGSKLALIPPLNVEIPLFGTIAGTLGIFFGGLVAGVVGALAMDMIDRMIKRRLKQEIVQDEIDTKNKIIRVQINTNGLMMEMLSYRKGYNRKLIEDSHNQTHAKMKEISEKIIKQDVVDKSFEFKKMDELIDLINVSLNGEE